MPQSPHEMLEVKQKYNGKFAKLISLVDDYFSNWLAGRMCGEGETANYYFLSFFVVESCSISWALHERHFMPPCPFAFVVERSATIYVSSASLLVLAGLKRWQKREKLFSLIRESFHVFWLGGSPKLRTKNVSLKTWEKPAAEHANVWLFGDLMVSGSSSWASTVVIKISSWDFVCNYTISMRCNNRRLNIASGHLSCKKDWCRVCFSITICALN